MVRANNDDDPYRDPVEALGAELIERQRNGEFLSVSEFAREHPELADEIRERLPAMLALDALKKLTETFP